MNNRIEILKGLHPGKYLQYELKTRKIKSGMFAKSIGEYPQTLSAIMRERRSMNTALSLRIEHALGLEEGFLMMLQVYYDIEAEKRKLLEVNCPDLEKFRTVLFWDTSIDKIDFNVHKRYVINRTFERGTATEIGEVIRFYGKDEILKSLDLSGNSPFNSIVKNNLRKFL